MKITTIQACLDFLDRVSTTGHKEHLIFQNVVEELVTERNRLQDEEHKKIEDRKKAQWLAEQEQNVSG